MPHHEEGAGGERYPDENRFVLVGPEKAARGKYRDEQQTKAQEAKFMGHLFRDIEQVDGFADFFEWRAAFQPAIRSVLRVLQSQVAGHWRQHTPWSGEEAMPDCMAAVRFFQGSTSEVAMATCFT